MRAGDARAPQAAPSAPRVCGAAAHTRRRVPRLREVTCVNAPTIDYRLTGVPPAPPARTMRGVRVGKVADAWLGASDRARTPAGSGGSARRNDARAACLPGPIAAP
eukprot:gene1109-1522_t